MTAAISAAEFARAMDWLGPWDAERRVAVAVSGGPDSLALAVLAKAWGNPVAFIVDHGLRPESGTEAAAAQATLAGQGIAASVLPLSGLPVGPGLAQRARHARYAALSAACRQSGLVDLLLGHHAGDQAETVLLRQRAGSGPQGLAAMAAVTEGTDLRLLRPLLAFPPERLAAVVAAAGLVAAQDPTNTDPRSIRARLRQEIGQDRAALLQLATGQGSKRAANGPAVAAELAARVQVFAAGFAVLSPGALSAEAMAAVLRTVSGRRYPISGVAELAAAPRAATLGGARIVPAGKIGPGWLVVREEAAMADPVDAAAGTVWDGRFRVAKPLPGHTLGALGADAAALRRLNSWPAAVLRTLPALRCNATLSAVPHLDYAAPNWESVAGPAAVHNAAVPIAGAAFTRC